MPTQHKVEAEPRVTAVGLQCTWRWHEVPSYRFLLRRTSPSRMIASWPIAGTTVVYSTEVGHLSRLRLASENCRCTRPSMSRSRPDRREAAHGEKGRGGKTVTVVDGLPRNASFLKDLCQN